MTQATLPEDPRAGGSATRLLRGARYLTRAWGFVFSEHPSLLKYCALPLMISMAVITGVVATLGYYYNDIVGAIWARPEQWYWMILWYLMYVFMLLLVIVVGYVAFFLLQTLLSAPFNDMLTEQVELIAYGKTPPPFNFAKFARGIAVSLVHALIKLSIYLVFMLPLLLLGWVIPFVGPVISSVGGFIVTAYFICYDQMDFSMARREWSFGNKIRVVTANMGLTFGLGGAMAGMLWIPIIGILFLPLAAVGGTLLFCDLERNGALVHAGPQLPAAVPPQQSSPPGHYPPQQQPPPSYPPGQYPPHQ